MEMLKSTIQDMEKERDFYFGKLRNIEVICQEKEGEEDQTLMKIMDILYATDVSPVSCPAPLWIDERLGMMMMTTEAATSHSDLPGGDLYPSTA